jgi:hypothetical protein
MMHWTLESTVQSGGSQEKGVDLLTTSIQNTTLFASTNPTNVGVGFHNVGSGVLRASNEVMVKYVEHHYGERCGHLPLNAGNIRVLVDQYTPDLRAQMDYLSQLFGKTIAPQTLDELRAEKESAAQPGPLVVPYINVPETETYIHDSLGSQPWGLPGNMTHALKNKANFYQLADELDLDGFCPPDYTVSNIYDLTRAVTTFLSQVEQLYKQSGVAAAYPLGVMLRAAESDGNYGCCLVYENHQSVIVVPNGDADHAQRCAHWQAALAMSQQHLVATMNPQKEARIVISRYIDFEDSPGMSVVVMDDQVESLGWNGQLQKEGSKACVGTSTYIPKNPHMQRLQQQYEEQTAAFFETFLRKTAQKCNINFASIRGVANIDIMIPGALEQKLQQSRKQPAANYLAECNPRWTNYTDAIMTILGANRKAQTVSNMKAVIQAGICTFDKHPLPEKVDPHVVRTSIAERDSVLKSDGTRIICRMAKNPMGLILAGNVNQAQQEVQDILAALSNR